MDIANKYLLTDKGKWWVLLAIGTGTFMTALDTSVVNTVLPIIQTNFSSNIATVEWVVIVYLLLVSGLLPIFGRFGDISGHKKIYIIGFVAFLLSSLFCAFSPTIYLLISARALQALGASMLSANSPAILTKSFPDQQRGQALGMQATMTYLGLTVGPSLGGWLTELYGWRSVFYINIPVGLIALTLSLVFITKDLPGRSHENFDLIGSFIFMTGLIALLLGLNQGHNWGWTSPLTLAVIGVSILLLSSFIAIEKRLDFPVLDLRLFKNKLFANSIISAILNYICIYSTIFLLPFYLIQGRLLSPSQAGLFLTAQPITMAVIAPLSGTISDRIGTRIPTTIGMSISAIGLFLLSKLDITTPNCYLILSLIVFGIGVGIFISPNNSALLGSAPKNRQGIASGLLATSRNVGMVLGIGLSGAIFTTVISYGAPNNNYLLIQGIQYSFIVSAILASIGAIISSRR